jgi:hypothetical protein
MDPATLSLDDARALLEARRGAAPAGRKRGSFGGARARKRKLARDETVVGPKPAPRLAPKPALKPPSKSAAKPEPKLAPKVAPKAAPKKKKVVGRKRARA